MSRPESADPARVIVADDHPLFRDALVGTLREAFAEVEIITADAIGSLQTAIETHADVDLLLLDLNMPGASGFSALLFVRSHYPTLPVAVISGMEQPWTMRRAMAHGASGFIPKSLPSQDIITAIRAICEGEVWLPAHISQAREDEIPASELDIADRLSQLTPQQFRVAMMLGEGLLNKQIAYDLGISEATIKAHLTAIMRKLGVRNRTQAVVAMAQLNLDNQQTQDVAESDAAN